MLGKFYPARATACKHGRCAAFFKPCKKLGRFFHYGQIRSHVHIEALYVAELLYSRNHFALHVGADGQTESLPQSRPYGRRREENDFLFGIDYSPPHVRDGALFIQRADGAGDNALTAIYAGRKRQRNVERRAYDFGVTPVFGTYCADSLLLARGDATRTHDAFGVIPHNRRG